MKRLRLFHFVALAAAACATNTPKQGRSADACALLPKNTAEKVLGASLLEPKSQGFGENPRQTVISNCLYVAQDSPDFKSLNFTIRLGSVKSTAVSPAENHINTMKQEFGQRYELKQLSGLADGAVWADSMKQLTVFRGTDTFVLVAPGATAPDVEAKLVTLAKKVIE